MIKNRNSTFSLIWILDVGPYCLACKTNKQWSERKQQAKPGPTNEQQWSEMKLEWPENGGNNGNIMKNHWDTNLLNARKRLLNQH